MLRIYFYRFVIYRNVNNLFLFLIYKLNFTIVIHIYTYRKSPEHRVQYYLQYQVLLEVLEHVPMSLWTGACSRSEKYKVTCGSVLTISKRYAKIFIHELILIHTSTETFCKTH